MHQVSHFKTHMSGCERISSLVLSLTLCALSLSRQQSWICFSTLSAHFSDFFFLSMVSHKWRASSLQWSSFFESGSTSSREAKLSWVLLGPVSQKHLNGMIIFTHRLTVGEKIILTLKMRKSPALLLTGVRTKFKLQHNGVLLISTQQVSRYNNAH